MDSDAFFTAVGLYESGWCYKEDEILYSFLIPFHAQAELVLPNVDMKNVDVNGVSLEESSLDYSKDEDNVIIVLKTGRYEFAIHNSKA